MDASFWIADQFPLDFRQQIFPVLDLLSAYAPKFQQLKPFIDLKLPIGFPIKIKIPLLQLPAYAEIAFHLLEPTESFQFDVPPNFSLTDGIDESTFFLILELLYADAETEQEIINNGSLSDTQSQFNKLCAHYLHI